VRHACRHPRAFILLELVIALGLTAILLTVLFRFFAGSVRMDRKVEDARASLYQRQHFQTRLSKVFTSIVPRSSLPPSSGSSFYTLDEKSTGFVAVFDNGIDPEPAFSGPILGKVFLDDGNLSLALWPIEKKEKKLYRKEVLLRNVENMRFQFLAKKTFQNPDAAAIAINPTLEWRTNWPKNRWDIPSTIRLIVLQEGQEIAFAFTLPLIEPIVTYHKPGGKG
jgi:type II secretory pathway pseudopilin PulG